MLSLTISQSAVPTRSKQSIPCGLIVKEDRKSAAKYGRFLTVIGDVDVTAPAEQCCNACLRRSPAGQLFQRLYKAEPLRDIVADFVLITH